MGQNCCGNSQTLLVLDQKNELIIKESHTKIIIDKEINTPQEGQVQQDVEEGMFEIESFEQDSHRCPLVEQNINNLKCKEPFNNFRTQKKIQYLVQDISMHRPEEQKVSISVIQQSQSKEKDFEVNSIGFFKRDKIQSSNRREGSAEFSERLIDQISLSNKYQSNDQLSRDKLNQSKRLSQSNNSQELGVLKLEQSYLTELMGIHQKNFISCLDSTANLPQFSQRSQIEPRKSELIEKDILSEAFEFQMRKQAQKQENNGFIQTKNYKHQKSIRYVDQTDEKFSPNRNRRSNFSNNQLLPERRNQNPKASSVTLMKQECKNQLNLGMSKPPKSTYLQQYKAQKNIQFQQFESIDYGGLILEQNIKSDRINRQSEQISERESQQIFPQQIPSLSPSQNQKFTVKVKKADSSQEKQKSSQLQPSQQQPYLELPPKIVQKLRQRKKTIKNIIVYVPDPKITISPDLFIIIKKGEIKNYYDIGQEIGKGSFGLVRLVTQKITGITRAMKQIKKSSLFFEKEEVFFAEMQVLKILVHPNIIKIFEIYQDERNYFIISEYLSGGELSFHLTKIKHFDEQSSAKYMLQILQAVSYMHDQGIVHRDLKTQNMIFDDCTQEAQLKLIDFGASRKFQNGEVMSKRLGTAQFIAPEVLIRQYDEKCDVWSCGVILFILLSGQFPFTGINEKHILKSVKLGTYSLERYLTNIDISEGAISLVKKMLTFDKDQRITAKQALNDPWIQFHKKKKTIDSQTMNNLATVRVQQQKMKQINPQLQKMSILQQIVIVFMANQLITQNQNQEIRNSFQSMDDNQNGSISIDELHMCLNKKKQTFISQQVMNIFDKIDLDKNGKVDYNEYVISAMNKNELLSENKMQQAFEIFDNDQDGFISKNDLENVIGTFESKVWLQILSDCDVDKNGKISLTEFKDCLKEQF